MINKISIALSILLLIFCFAIQGELSQLQSDVNSISEIDQSYATFTPGSKGFSSIHTGVGDLLVILESLKKYANGYQATFNIGNPNFVTYNGIKMLLKWGEANQSDTNSSDSYQSLKSVKVEINKRLLPGTWNKVTVVLSPATSDETGFIYLALELHQVMLNADSSHITS
jgi:hypothetical protein